MTTEHRALVGILGGMSWESTVTYYQEINRRYHAHYGGHHSAPMLIHSVDFAPIEEMQSRADWAASGRVLAEAAQGLERAGAGVLLLATNTMHLVFDTLQSATSAPWIHIADATGEALQADGHRAVGLLGTRFTMEEAFYRRRLEERFGLTVHVPDAHDRGLVDRTIFEELVHGRIRRESRDRFRAIMRSLAEAGAEAVILGCTEIGLLVEGGDSPVPVYDTAVLHAQAAVDWLVSHHQRET
jgi:aspartate racemase